MTTSPLYDSRALTFDQWRATWNHRLLNLREGNRWEWKHKPSEGVIYLRRHIGGPLSTETEGWCHD